MNRETIKEYVVEVIKDSVITKLIDMDECDIKYACELEIPKITIGKYTLEDISYELWDSIDYNEIGTKWLSDIEVYAWYEVMVQDEFVNHLADRIIEKYHTKEVE